MNPTILLISGPIAVGKTTVRDWLVRARGFRMLSSSAYLQTVALARELLPNRANLQLIGDELDTETDFRWVVDSVAIPAIEANPTTERWIFDSIRKRRQHEHFRARFRTSVVHAHLTAPEETLRRRFELRRVSNSQGRDAAGYDSASSHPNELEARSLNKVADVVVAVEGHDLESILKDVLAKFEES